jgi:hypothetical protein
MFTTACYINGHLSSFYTHETIQECVKVMQFYLAHPSWHLYNRIVQKDNAQTVIDQFIR